VVQLPQLTEIPIPEPAAVDDQGDNQAPARRGGAGPAQPQNGGGRQPQSGNDDNRDTGGDKGGDTPTTSTTPPTTTTTTTTTTTSKPPPSSDPPTGDTGPSSVQGQPGEEDGGPQVPIDDPSSGDPEGGPAT
jgi:hypothetical protein